MPVGEFLGHDGSVGKPPDGAGEIVGALPRRYARDFMSEKIKELLAAKPGDKRYLEIAVCALLLEMAKVDFDYAPVEKETIVAVLGRQFQMTNAELEQLIELAEGERVRYPDLGPFTRAISEGFSQEEKSELLLMLWHVVAADKRLDSYEELLMRRLQPALGVTQEMVAEARELAYKTDPLNPSPDSEG
jgi:uncharacterized tellurite resistance protein B-like protein